MHPLPSDPEEVNASLRAGERCMRQLPYLGLRYGARGEAFARTDSGYLTTLVQGSQEYVTEQAKWLARLLANRGMPRWLMEVHLDILVDELSAAIPEKRNKHAKLHQASAVLRDERQSVIAQNESDCLVAGFVEKSGNAIENFGGLVVSAVCDEFCGIENAVPSLVEWTESQHQLPAVWRAAVISLVEDSHQAAARNLSRLTAK